MTLKKILAFKNPEDRVQHLIEKINEITESPEAGSQLSKIVRRTLRNILSTERQKVKVAAEPELDSAALQSMILCMEEMYPAMVKIVDGQSIK